MKQEKLLYQEVERMTLSYRVIKNHQVDIKESTADIPIISTEKLEKVIEKNSGDLETQQKFMNLTSQIDEIKERAEKQANLIIDQANQEAQKIRAEAQERGYEEGIQKGQELGYKEGYQKALQDIEEIKKQASELLKNAYKESRKYIENTREEIVGLAVTIAEQILHCKIDVMDDSMMEMIKNALQQVEERKQVLFRCPSSSISVLQNYLEEFQKICPNAHFTFLEDNTIGKYGCILETEEQIIDLKIDSQLENVKTTLLEMRESSEL